MSWKLDQYQESIKLHRSEYVWSTATKGAFAGAWAVPLWVGLDVDDRYELAGSL